VTHDRGNDERVDPPVTQQRAELMKRVRRQHTAPEISVRRWLYSRGFRYRLHRKDLPGTPDIVLPRHKLAIFVHGCFWHQHPGCRRATIPRTRVQFWEAKFAENARRDCGAEDRLRALGWNVVTVWECQASSDEQLLSVLCCALPLAGDRG